MAEIFHRSKVPLSDFFGAAADSTTEGAGFAGQLTVGVKATGLAELTALGTDLGVEIRAILILVGCGSRAAACFSSCHCEVLPLH